MHTCEGSFDVYDADSRGNCGRSSECLCAKLVRAPLANGAVIAGSLHMYAGPVGCLQICANTKRYTAGTRFKHSTIPNIFSTTRFLLCCMCVAVSNKFVQYWRPVAFGASAVVWPTKRTCAKVVFCLRPPHFIHVYVCIWCFLVAVLLPCMKDERSCHMFELCLWLVTILIRCFSKFWMFNCWPRADIRPRWLWPHACSVRVRIAHTCMSVDSTLHPFMKNVGQCTVLF